MERGGLSVAGKYSELLLNCCSRTYKRFPVCQPELGSGDEPPGAHLCAEMTSISRLRRHAGSLRSGVKEPRFGTTPGLGLQLWGASCGVPVQMRAAAGGGEPAGVCVPGGTRLFPCGSRRGSVLRATARVGCGRRWRFDS